MIIRMNFLKKTIVLLFLFGLLLFPKIVSAHVLEVDGNIGGVLHIAPDDDPVAGQNTSIVVELKDKSSQFSSVHCDCTYSLVRSGKTILSESLFTQANTDSTVHLAFTFPEKDIYTLEIVGKPKQPGQFQEFHLNYLIRVDKEISPQVPEMNHSTIPLPIIVGVFISVVIVGIFLVKGKKKYLAVFAVSLLFIHLFPIVLEAKELHSHDHSRGQHSCCLPQQMILPHQLDLQPVISRFTTIHFETPESFPYSWPSPIRNRSP